MTKNYNDYIEYYRKVGKRIRGDKRQNYKLKDLE